MNDNLDVPLEDADLKEEVELVSSLIVAAGESDEQLDPEQIDALLGVEPEMRVPEQQDRSAQSHAPQASHSM